jgi:transcriptional regulator with XRE-family HTH domain
MVAAMVAGNSPPEDYTMTGLDLKFARLTSGITVRKIAAVLGVSSQRVSTIEASLHPSPGMVARYRAALDDADSSQGAGWGAAFAPGAVLPGGDGEGPRS